MSLSQTDDGPRERLGVKTAALLQIVEERRLGLAGGGAEKFTGFFGEILR